MLSLDRCREILGERAPMDEQQLAEVRDQADRMARLLLEVFRQVRTGDLEDGRAKE